MKIRHAMAVLLSFLLAAAAVSQEHCSSRSFSSSENRVLEAYIGYYGRPADTGGLAFWAGRLDAGGGGLAEIIQAFGVSAEYQSRFGSLTNEQLIDNIYLQLFGRTADPGGFNFYLARISAGTMTLQTASLQILDGAVNEDAVILANRLAVARYYVTLSEQDPSVSTDADTLATYISSVLDDTDASAQCRAIASAFGLRSPGADITSIINLLLRD